MWVELVDELYEDVDFAEPASEAEVDEVSRRLGQELSAGLRALLRESDGCYADEFGWLVYSAREVIECNLNFRDPDAFADVSMSFDQLIFFADNGGGDQFGFVAYRTSGTCSCGSRIGPPLLGCRVVGGLPQAPRCRRRGRLVSQRLNDGWSVDATGVATTTRGRGDATMRESDGFGGPPSGGPSAGTEWIERNVELVRTQLSAQVDFEFGVDRRSLVWVEGFLERQRANPTAGAERLVPVLGSFLGQCGVAAGESIVGFYDSTLALTATGRPSRPSA